MKVTGSSCGGFPGGPMSMEVIKHFLNCLSLSCLRIQGTQDYSYQPRSHGIYQWLLQQPPACTVLFLGRGSAKGNLVCLSVH